jgi:hypothetical protein
MGLVQNTDYRIQGYLKVPTIDTLGDVSMVEYYRDYDSGTETYSNLMVRETTTINRNSLGIPASETKSIGFFKSGVEVTTKSFTRYYDEENGYQFNQDSRQRLIDRASIYLFNSLVTEYGAIQGAEKTYEFLNDIIIGKEEYTAGNKGLLISEVNNSTRDYMTAERKTQIDTILNVSYIPT